MVNKDEILPNISIISPEEGAGNIGTEAIEVYLRQIVSFDQSSVLATADDRGKVKIESQMESEDKVYDMTFDLTIADDHGNPIQGAEAIYSQVNGKCLIYFYDPVGDYTSGLIIGTPEELKEKLDGSGMKSANYAGPGSNLEIEEESAVVLIFIAAVLTAGAIAIAEVSAIINMYEIQTFYLTKGVGWPGLEALRNALLENAIEKWGIARSELEGGRKFAVKIFPYEEDATMSSVRNLFAVYQILEESPECSIDGKVLHGTIQMP